MCNQLYVRLGLQGAVPAGDPTRGHKLTTAEVRVGHKLRFNRARQLSRKQTVPRELMRRRYAGCPDCIALSLDAEQNHRATSEGFGGRLVRGARPPVREAHRSPASSGPIMRLTPSRAVNLLVTGQKPLSILLSVLRQGRSAWFTEHGEGVE